MALVTFETDTLHVLPWEGGPVDGDGFDPRAAYVERFWLGVVGPSTTWLLRRIAAGFDAAPDGFDMSLGETARALGLGDRQGRNSPLFRTLNRMVQFDLAKMRDPGTIEVLRRLPPLSARHVARLSPALQEAHDRWRSRGSDLPAGEAARRRARQLALSLLELGEDGEAVERQLLRWGYHPALASDAIGWAGTRHRQALVAAAATG